MLNFSNFCLWEFFVFKREREREICSIGNDLEGVCLPIATRHCHLMYCFWLGTVVALVPFCSYFLDRE